MALAPDPSGAEVLLPLKQMAWGTSIVSTYADVNLLCSTLELGTQTFLAYGYVSEDAHPNKVMASLRKQPFTGEIIIFQKGTLILVLLQPHAKKPILNKVITAFAKRLEDAYCMQTSLNEVIL
ncbi:hypothetical protein DXG01_015072, partial [Tephrocybe rancida]